MEGLQKAFVIGRQRDIYFGMPAIEYVYEKIPQEAFARLGSGEFQTADVKTIAHFLYAGLLGGVERKDDTPDFDFGMVYEAVEGMLLGGDEHKVMQAVGLAFSQSNTIKWHSEKNKKKADVKEAKTKKSTGGK